MSTTNAACSLPFYAALGKENWNLLFAQSGIEGLAILKEQGVDLVVSDMRMPQMDGATFLKQTAMLAIMMHDLSKLVLAQYASEPYWEFLESTGHGQSTLLEAACNKRATPHASVSGDLAQSRHLPSQIVDAVRHHHDLERAQAAPQLTHLIHRSNALAHRLALGSSGPVRETEIAPTTYKMVDLRPEALDQLEEELHNTDLIPI